MKPKFWQIAVVVALTATLTIGLAGFVRAINNDWFGSVSVQIHEREGVDLSLKIPTFLARAALRILPGQVEDYVRTELEEWGPAVCAAYEELERCPNATLVSIESGDETVQISMWKNTFIVEVTNYDERVRIAVPVAIVGDVLNQLDLDLEL